ncbi:MAG: hypothetical protein KF761_12795 [Salinibacterium sp.]|nr:hypothetical protein [Salinibacterium sp.]
MTAPNTTDARRPNFWLHAIESRKHELMRTYRASLSDRAREGISDADYATTMATLEKMAGNLGWDDAQRPDRASDRHDGHGHRHHGMMRRFGNHPRHPEELSSDSTTSSDTER